MLSVSFVLIASGMGDAGRSSEAGLSPADFTVLAVVIGSIMLFGGATVLALGWAFRSGQFDNFHQGAASIFGPDEPIGEPTDAFPGEAPAPGVPEDADW